MSYPVGPAPVGMHYGTYFFTYVGPTVETWWPDSVRGTWGWVDGWTVWIRDATGELMGTGNARWLWLARHRARKDASFWELGKPYERWGLIRNGS